MSRTDYTMRSSTAAVQGPRKVAATAALYEYIVVSYVISSYMYRDVTDVVDVRYYDELQMYSQEILPSLIILDLPETASIYKTLKYVIVRTAQSCFKHVTFARACQSNLHAHCIHTSIDSARPTSDVK